MTKAIVLFSGGLDSTLAAGLLQRQGIELVGLNVRTPFTDSSVAAQAAADALGMRLVIRDVDASYAEMLRNPKWGFGKAVNPCIECHAFMYRMGKQLMEEEDAQFVVSGELVGQRPNSQKAHQLALINKESGLGDRLLRPLSAQALPETAPEREGLVDREQLGNYTGRARTPLFALAKELGVDDVPQPSTGCLLTERSFAPRIRDLLRNDPDASYWSFRLTAIGRHLRISPEAKAAIGRNEKENRALEALFNEPHEEEAFFLYPFNFNGPAVVWIGPNDEESIQKAGAILLRFAGKKRYDPENAIAEITHAGETRKVQIHPDPAFDELKTL